MLEACFVNVGYWPLGQFFINHVPETSNIDQNDLTVMTEQVHSFLRKNEWTNGSTHAFHVFKDHVLSIVVGPKASEEAEKTAEVMLPVLQVLCQTILGEEKLPDEYSESVIKPYRPGTYTMKVQTQLERGEMESKVRLWSTSLEGSEADNLVLDACKGSPWRKRCDVILVDRET